VPAACTPARSHCFGGYRWLARIALADARRLTWITLADAWWLARHLDQWLAGIASADAWQLTCIALADVRQHALWLARIAGIASADVRQLAIWLAHIASADAQQLAHTALADAQRLPRITSVDAWWCAWHLTHWLAGYLASLRRMSDSLPYGSLASLRRMPSDSLTLLWQMPRGLLVLLRLMPGGVHGILLTGSLASSHRFVGCLTACHQLACIASVDARRLARTTLADAQQLTRIASVDVR